MSNGVWRRMSINNGLYVPSNLVKGRFIHFAADNLDFKDTDYGQNTLHATIYFLFTPKRRR